MDGEGSNNTAVDLGNTIRVNLDIVSHNGAIGGSDGDHGIGHRKIVFTVKHLY